MRVSDAAPVAGRTVVFKVAGQTICSATTSSAGKASCTVNAIVIGSGSYSASFAGDGTYLPSSATAPL
jgi:Big-like domain-containing protein